MSLPTLVTNVISPPSLAAATAWLRTSPGIHKEITSEFCFTGQGQPIRYYNHVGIGTADYKNFLHGLFLRVVVSI
jgi:hypothetical protein